MIDLKKRWTYGAEMEALRRVINRQNLPNDPSSFRLDNIDWPTLYNVYPNDVPSSMKDMFDKHGIEISIENKPFYYSSPVIIGTLESENKKKNYSNSIKWHENISEVKCVYYGDVDHPVPGQIDHWVS